jgi:ABC-2 type transport system permease protein
MTRAFRLTATGFIVAFHSRQVDMPLRLFFTSGLFRIALQVLFFSLVGLYAGGVELMRYVLIGNVVWVAAFPAIVLVTSFLVAEREEGTLSYLVTTPSGLVSVILGQSFYYACEALVGVIMIAVMAFPFMGTSSGFMSKLGAFGLTCLVCLTLTGLGLVVGSLVFRSRWDMVIAPSVSYVLAVIAGVNIPVSSLPPALAMIGPWLPLSNGLEAIRLTLAGNGHVHGLVGRELLVGMLCWVVGWHLFSHSVRTGRRKGSLERF